MSIIPDEDIGGARVLRTFSRVLPDGKTIWHKRGELLTREVVLSFNPTNRHHMIDSRFIEIRDVSRDRSNEPRDRFIITTGKNEYGVIEGRKLNAKPLSKEDAEDLATE